MSTLVVADVYFAVSKPQDQLLRDQLRELRKFLNVTETPEEDYIRAEEARMSGTCEWFSTKNAYLKWQNFASDAPRVLWIKGKPATGKSILAGYAIDQLHRSNANCSYFFFKHGDKSKSRLGACLRSLAFQMACTNEHVREILLNIQIGESSFDKDNERTVWRKLFSAGIFKAQLTRNYWVIDGLDECGNISPFFDLMLAKLDDSIPLRILITSRETSELENHFTTLGVHQFHAEGISTADTLPDIKLFVETRARSLGVMGDDDRAALVNKVLAKSKGSFLWTVLVLNELSNCYSEEEIKEVLDDVPRDMEPLYQRTLETMSQATRGKKLTKAILTWATSSIRPLTTNELDGALKLDVKDNFLNLEKTVTALCGQLVTVDIYGKIQMVHETAREFLLRRDLEFELAIKEKEAHTQMARACLTYLTGPEMKPPRAGRRGPAMTSPKKRTSFSNYACEAFSYHLSKSDPQSSEVLILLHTFLGSNVLSWIEVVAQTQDLVPLIRTARNLRRYFKIRSAEMSPLGKEMQVIKGWTTDLFRIAAKFADALVLSPSSIFTLILPFCPTESTIYKTSTSGRKLSIVGHHNTHWDDRLACIDFQEGQASTICHGDEFFAVGLTTGNITLYHATSCQEFKTLHHGEAVKHMQFKSCSNSLASCGMRSVKIWDIRSGDTIHSFKAPPRPISLIFDDNILSVASHKNYLASWDLNNDGLPLPDKPWRDSDDESDTPLHRQPSAISISISHKMMAVAYSGRPITLWDLEEDSYYGTCGKKLPNGETSSHIVSALVFNPNVNISLLAASYLDGELAVLDPFNDQEIESVRADCHTLAVSPDGRLLAGSAGSGTIHIYGFDTLKLLYRVKSSNFYVKQLSFSGDNLHFADVRASQCNIWEPAVLLRDLVDDDSSESTSTSIFETVSPDAKSNISAILLHPDGEVVFCGKADGSVCWYELKTGVQLKTLYRHKSLVRIVTWMPHLGIIMSIDASNGIFAWKLHKTQAEGWETRNQAFQSRLDCGKSIIQVLNSETTDKFILSTRESDHLWSAHGHEEQILLHAKTPGVRKWIQHPQSPLHILCIEGAAARIYSWNDFSDVAAISIPTCIQNLQLKSANLYTSKHYTGVLLELSELDGSAKTCSVRLLDSSSFDLPESSPKDAAEVADKCIGASTESAAKDTKTANLLFSPQLKILDPYMAHVIGFSNNGKLLFLDTSSWVCSVELESLGTTSVSYLRHFFVPYDWFSGTREVICAVTRRDVLFARHEDIAIVKGGLEHIENVKRIAYLGEE